MNKYLLIILSMFLWSCYEPPKKVRYSGIKKTMGLLNTSTYRLPNNINIFFYGQSIIKGMKPYILIDSLRKLYPNTKISYKSKAIGGFPIPDLIKTAEHDLYHENPDLIIFHAYGGIKDGLYDSLIKRIRKRMSSDVLIFDHHYRWDKPSEKLQKRNKSDEYDSSEIEKIAKKYDCGFINVREQWRDYLESGNIQVNELMGNTVDPNVHPNEKGNKLLRKIILSKFKEKKKSEYISKKDNLRELVSLENNSKTIIKKIKGNRIELTVDSIQNNAKIKVLINGIPPSKYNSSYYIDRPSKAFNCWMPAIEKVSFGEKFPLEEKWIITIYDIDRKLKKFKFKLDGSKTGFDGEGSSDRDFTSNSRRILIKKEDLMIFKLERITKKETPNNFQIKFNVRKIVRDTIHIKEEVRNYTLFKGGLSEYKIQLEVLEGNLKFEKLIVYKPYLER